MSFWVRGKRFTSYLVDHHGSGRVELQCKAERGLNAMLADRAPDRFFMPPYMAHHGWIAMYLDVGAVPWDEVEAFITEAYQLTAPRTLVKALGSATTAD